MLENVMTHIAHRVTEYYLVEAASGKGQKKKVRKLLNYFLLLPNTFLFG